MKKLLLTAALTVSIGVANAQWAQSGGMTGTNPYAFCSKGNVLWAGTNYGTRKSTDHGQTFTPANNGMASTATVFALLTSGSSLFAGTAVGLYRSVDDGANWVLMTAGFPTSNYVGALMAKGTKLFASTGSGVYASSDNGLTWSASNTGLGSNSVGSLVTDGSALYVGTDHGVFKSTDDGANWTSSSTGLPSYVQVSALIINGTMIHAGMGNDSKIFNSTNGGASWTAGTNSLSCNSINGFALDGNLLFASGDQGFIVSADNGGSCAYNNAGISVPTLKSVFVDGNYAYVGVVNNGAYWRALSDFGTVSPPTAIKENRMADVSIYPNPSHGKIQISNPDRKAISVSVYNVTGKEILSQPVSEGKTEIDLGESISTGIYFVRLNSGNESVTKKLIIE